MQPEEPSGPIQSLTPGLLELLQLKNRGRNPAVLRDDVQPSIDLLQFYLQGQVQVETRNTLSANQGAINILSVFGANSAFPTWVHTYSVYIPVGGATTDITAVALTLVDPVSNAVHSILAAKTFTTAIAGANRFVALTTGGFWRGAGVGLGAIIACNVAGTALAPQFTLRSTPTATR